MERGGFYVVQTDGAWKRVSERRGKIDGAHFTICTRWGGGEGDVLIEFAILSTTRSINVESDSNPIR